MRALSSLTCSLNLPRCCCAGVRCVRRTLCLKLFFPALRCRACAHARAGRSLPSVLCLHVSISPPSVDRSSIQARVPPFPFIRFIFSVCKPLFFPLPGKVLCVGVFVVTQRTAFFLSRRRRRPILEFRRGLCTLPSPVVFSHCSCLPWWWVFVFVLVFAVALSVPAVPGGKLCCFLAVAGRVS